MNFPTSVTLRVFLFRLYSIMTNWKLMHVRWLLIPLLWHGLSVHAIAENPANLGFQVRIAGVEQSSQFAGHAATTGNISLILDVEVLNDIDPFLVFDYGVDETITILRLQDRAFLVGASGRTYRLDPTLFGKEGHFGQNIRLQNSGSKVSGKLAFLVQDTDLDALELRVYDENFAAIRVPVVGKVNDSMLPKGAELQSNTAVSFAVGDHGPAEIAGRTARAGMQFYFVDLWGRADWTREVPAYFLQEGADAKAKAPNGFFFEYKRSHEMLSLVTGGGYAAPVIPDFKGKDVVHPVFLPGAFTRTRLHFEVPVSSAKLEFQALFAKMGLSDTGASALPPLRFVLREGGDLPMQPEAQVVVQDTTGTNELTVSLALVADPSQWGIDPVTRLGVWVRFENTGAEAGLMNPVGRFELTAPDGSTVRSVAGSPYDPPSELYLELGIKRSFLVVFPKQGLGVGEPFLLNYSGIGGIFEFDIDPSEGSMRQRKAERAQNGSSFVAETVVQSEPAKPLSVDESASNSNVVEATTDTSPVQEPEVVLVPYQIELPPPYDVQAKERSARYLERMAQAPFVSLPEFDWSTFESVLGSASVSEVEDNAKKESASAIPIGITAKGELTKGDRDVWRFTVPEGTDGEKTRFQVHLSGHVEAEGFEGWYLRLLPERGSPRYNSWLKGMSAYTLLGLRLEPGDYFIQLESSGDHPSIAYFLKVISVVAQTAFEVEPNARIEDASPLERNTLTSGVLDAGDTLDLHRFVLSEKDRGKQFEIAIRTDQPEVTLNAGMVNAKGDWVYHDRQQGTMVMPDLSPPPGEYYVKMEIDRGPTVRYQIELIEVGKLENRRETEPNDYLHSPAIPVIRSIDDTGPELLGRLGAYYGDYFAIDVTDPEAVYHVTLGGPAKGRLDYVTRSGKRLASISSDDQHPASFVDLRLPLGLNYFYVEGDAGDYAINVQKVPVPGETYEWEPNDDDSQAKFMQLGLAYQGRCFRSWDRDWYRFVVNQPGHYRVRLQAPSESVFQWGIFGNGFPQKWFETSKGNTLSEETLFLLPGDYRIRVQAKQPSLQFYALQVDMDPFQGALIPPVVEGLAVQVLNDSLTAAAFHDGFQEVIQSVRLKNEGTTDLELTLWALSSNIKVTSGDGNPARLRLEPGQEQQLDLSWHLEPQLPANEAILLWLGWSDGDRTTVSHARLQLDPSAVAERILQGKRQLDDRLAGALNLNALALGALPVLEPATLYASVKPPSESYLSYLMDGALAYRSFYGTEAIIKLAGDGTSPILATSIELHGRGSLWESAKAFSIDVSSDGTQFEEVFTGELRPVTGSQVFLFEKPLKGTHARLRLHDRQDGVTTGNKTAHLGEWRMLAAPDQPLVGLGEVDLLAGNRGGHVIPDGERVRIYGFHHNRAARVRELRWTNQALKDDRYSNPLRVSIEISEDSPVGPWRDVGSYDLKESDPETTSETRIPLEGEPWARFVRLAWTVDPSKRWTYEPGQIQFIEKTVGSDYRSLLGEWLGDSSFGYREYLEKQAGTPESVALKRIQSTKSKPYLLESERWVDSVAWINEKWEDWFIIDAVPVKQRLQFAVEAKPFIKVAVKVFDEKDREVEIMEVKRGAARTEFLLLAEPKVRYRVHVYEPKRSIVYLWDVSGSMSNFIASIENAVLKFAREIDPESEKVQLLPFDEPPRFLLEDWASDSYTLEGTVRNYDPPGSSYAHLSLKAATDLLKDQEGTKAAIVITDCETSRGINPQLWDSLREVKPAVFTFQTSDSTDNYGQEQDDMQDWAAVAGGFYRQTRAAHELDHAFAQVQAYLRRPAPYRIQLSVPQLRPSTIEVKDSRDAADIRIPANDGVLLIVDASASMREVLPGGEPRMSVAKTVIEELTQQYLPDGINFGMRVFGHRGGTDCVSELMLPVSPLDRAAAKQKLMFIRSSSLGNTSLGEALGKASEDLKSVTGLKRVVVLTDGQETCRGDPAAAIAKLADAGLDVTVNIVGFALNDASVKDAYGNWVRATGGKYYDASDASALGQALQEAMTPKVLPAFEVYDAAGELVARGQVGDAPMALDSGVYEVRILDPDNPRTEWIEAFEQQVSLEYR